MTSPHVIDLLGLLEEDSEQSWKELAEEIGGAHPEDYPLLCTQIEELRKGPAEQVAQLIGVALVAGGLLATRLPPLILLSVCLLLFIPFILASLRKRRRSASFIVRIARLCQLLGRVIEQKEDRRCLPALLTLLRLGTDAAAPADIIVIPIEVKRGILSALRRLVPQMTLQEFQALTPTQEQVLMSLSSYADLPLTLAIIEKMSAMSDPENRRLREMLNWFVKNGAATPNMQQVRTAAREGLLRLYQRALDEKEAQSLLRASDVPLDPASETLLRAAAGTTATDSEQLLRAEPGEGRHS